MTLRVTGQSKLKAALDLGPAVLEYIIALNPHDFSRLRNPLMRRLMPPRIRIERVAQMVGIPTDQIVLGIHDAAGIHATPEDLDRLAVEERQAEPLPTNSERAPDWIDNATVVVDLLESDERLDADPLPPIMRAVKGMEEEDVVLIKHKWEPAPLYDVWSYMGVEHFAQRQGPDEWHIFVRRERD
ncbi:MAG: hypothetical protein AAF682_05340 [Planctomycetota bacterium]